MPVTDTNKLNDLNLILNLKNKMNQKGRKNTLIVGSLHVRGIREAEAKKTDC